jgi:hypothetical protein
MLGDTYPIVGIDRMSERRRDDGLAEYVRLEFRPADRWHVMFALRRASRVGRPQIRKARLPWRRRSWRAAPEPTGDSRQP